MRFGGRTSMIWELLGSAPQGACRTSGTTTRADEWVCPATAPAPIAAPRCQGGLRRTYQPRLAHRALQPRPQNEIDAGDGRWGEQGGRDEGGEATGLREGPSSQGGCGTTPTVMWAGWSWAKPPRRLRRPGFWLRAPRTTPRDATDATKLLLSRSLSYIMCIYIRGSFD